MPGHALRADKYASSVHPRNMELAHALTHKHAPEAAKELAQARLRNLSEAVGAADEFLDNGEGGGGGGGCLGEARTTFGVVNIEKCLLSPSVREQGVLTLDIASM